MPAAAITAPSPNGRRKLLPRRARAAAPGLPGRAQLAAFHERERPERAHDQEHRAAAATRCSTLSSRAARSARRARSAIVERPASLEAGVGLVLVADRVLALLPAEVDLAPSRSDGSRAGRGRGRAAPPPAHAARSWSRAARGSLGDRSAGCAAPIDRTASESASRPSRSPRAGCGPRACAPPARPPSGSTSAASLECVVAGVDHAPRGRPRGCGARAA